MKNSFLLFSVLLILCIQITKAQIPTYASLPDSSHVLVVFNSQDNTSIAIKNHYMNARNIPSINACPLNNLVESVNITYQEETHLVELTQQGEIIKDMVNTNSPTIHAWIYFNERIAIPIANYLETNYVNGTPLKDIIRFIVLCKGVPFRIDARQEDADSKMQNVICANLLTLIGETMEDEDALLFYYNKQTSVPNPYYRVDQNFSMEHFFLPNHYQTTVNIGGQNRDISLSYLVTHLSAPRLEDVDSMINRSIRAINETNYDWFIDADPTPCAGWNPIGNTESLFQELGITHYFFDNTENVYTSYNGNSVMSYSSNGTWTSIGDSCNIMPFGGNYIQTLDFDYADGAHFSSIESHNGMSIGTYPVIRTRGQGLIADFTLMGGTVATGQAFHSPGSHVIANEDFFPHYAMGYSFIEAAYMGMLYLNATNVIVGDPLTRIALPCAPTILTSSTEIYSGDYDCDIIVPEGITLTVISTPSNPVNFKRNAKLKIAGNLLIQGGSVVNFDSYSELRLETGSELNIQQNFEINFRDHSTFTINNEFTFVNNSQIIFDDNTNIVINGEVYIAESVELDLAEKVKIDAKGALFLNENSVLNFTNSAMINITGKMIMSSNSVLSFNNDATIIHSHLGSMYMFNGSTLNINGLAKFYSFGNLYLNEGSIINQNNLDGFHIEKVFKAFGNEDNKVRINFTNNGSLDIGTIDTLILFNTIVSSGYITLNTSDDLQIPRIISISNCIFNNSLNINRFYASTENNIEVELIDNLIYSNNINGGLSFRGFKNVLIKGGELINIASPLNIDFGIAIAIFDNISLSIENFLASGFSSGIVQARLFLQEVDATNSEDIRIYNCTLFGRGSDKDGSGISIGYVNSQTSGVKIDFNEISNFGSGITVNNDDDFALGIKNNTITNYGSFGISVSNGSEAVIKENIISVNEPDAESCVGISINQVSNPSIVGNTISAFGVTNPGSGIVSVSMTNGEIRKNIIQNHLHGMEFGSSSPNVAENMITDNHMYGIYISTASNPNLSQTTSGEYKYPLTGYNTIRENGICNFAPSYSEIYLREGMVKLKAGCNTIADDRDDPALHCDYLYLIDGSAVPEEISAQRNYWGAINGSNPEGRFGQSIMVNYDDYLLEPCTYSASSIEIIFADSRGEAFDTVHSTGEMAAGLSDIESRYAEANDYYYHNQFSQAKQEYEDIIQNYGNDNESIQAYNRLYTIANLTNSSPSVFSQLKDFYLQKAANQTDSLMIGTLEHLSDLCLVAAEEYLPAINNFDEIAQQNPNTDIALYRQIDALTTSLLMPQDSSLNKGVLGKYSVTNLSDYTNKLSTLLKTRGKSGLKSNEELLPTEFTLYQNYPNPFNPTTTIKYDLPNTSEVTLIIYDILGRKVKELVNTKQQAGRYELQFNASTLSSGVYIYQLVAEKYMQSRKMILLK